MANHNNSSAQGEVHRACVAVSAAILCLSFAISLLAQQPATSSSKPFTPALSGPIDFGSVNGFPELRVAGVPFFIHAAYFDYFSIPRDLWERSLDSYRDFEFNTIALRIPWNWHELREGEFDFDGSTNPRRDLRALLRLISDKGFKLIVAPGPVLDTPKAAAWRDGGIPEWLVSSCDDAPLNHEIFEQARTRGAERWLGAVADLLAPYSAAAYPANSAANAPLLYVILDAPAALGDVSGAAFWPRASELQSAMISAGLSARFVVTAAGAQDAAVRPPAHFVFDIAGRWTAAQTSAFADSSESGMDPFLATAADPLAALVHSLRLDAAAPVLIDNFALPARSTSVAPLSQEFDDMFLAWAYQIAHGAGGIVQSGFQQTLPPPGFKVAESAGHEDDHAILDVAGTSRRGAERERREANLIERYGQFFASSHPRTVLGIVDLRTSGAVSAGVDANTRASAASEFAVALPKILRVADFAQIPFEFADPASQDASQLLHDPVLLLAIPDSLRGVSFLSSAAQQSLLEFVRRGGSLICEPALPQGEEFADALRDARELPAGYGVLVRNLGQGRVISWTKDFFGWVNPAEPLAHARERPESASAAESLLTLVKQQSVSLPVVRAGHPVDALRISELVAHSAPPPQHESAQPESNSAPAAGGRLQGLLAVANWSETAANETVRILPPSVSQRTAESQDYIELPLSLRPRDALFLPLDAPLCDAAKFPERHEDRVVAAGAELVSYTREGKTLELTFYAPEKATIILHLEAPPHRVNLLERTLEGQYNTGSHTFTFELPRGAAPEFLRTVKLYMPYTPNVPEAPKPDRAKIRDFRASVVNAARYPVGADGSLQSFPPLLALDSQLNGRLLLNVQNLGDSFLTVRADISGTVAASRVIHLDAKERNDYAIDLQAGSAAKADGDGLLHATLHLSGGDRTVEIPLDLVVLDPGAPAYYRADFERSGSKNWILENDRLRVITAPASGGTVAAIMDKQIESSLLAAGGGLFDLIHESDSSDLSDLTLNSAFDPEWLPPANEATSINAVQLTGTTPPDASFKLQITKKIKLLSATRISLEYAARLSTPSNKPAPSLVTGFSVPAFTGAPGTQFCWTATGSSSEPDPSAASDPHCEPFTPNSVALHVPKNLQRIEIRDHNRPALIFECQSGFITVDQQGSSARILWNLPKIQTSADAFSPAQSNLATLTLGDDR